MKIEAATLAGGEVNQDYYAYGETYALVLDGASSFLPEQTSIDAVTYVKALGEALAEKLECCALSELSEIVVLSIEEVAARYGLVEESAPNSTVVIAKWNRKELATYALGDSSCLIFDNNGVNNITDSRISKFGNEVRDQYKNRLLAGFGFDEEHKKLLNKLQIIQKNFRNVERGYWIAGSLSKAGKHGVNIRFSLINVEKVVLCTDGGLSSFNSDKNNLKQMILERHRMEEADSDGSSMPRSKMHDDKTIVLVEF